MIMEYDYGTPGDPLSCHYQISESGNLTGTWQLNGAPGLYENPFLDGFSILKKWQLKGNMAT